MKSLPFDHIALSLKQNRMLVYTAISKHYFYFRMYISKYVLEKEKVPLNPFMLFDYFLLDAVERDLIREANNSLVLRADEIWVFGPISNGVLAEILLAQERDKPIHYFKIDRPHTIIPIEKDLIDLEEEVKEYKSLLCGST
jgi:hypothetical protein